MSEERRTVITNSLNFPAVLSSLISEYDKYFYGIIDEEYGFNRMICSLENIPTQTNSNILIGFLSKHIIKINLDIGDSENYELKNRNTFYVPPPKTRSPPYPFN